jgi:glycosyltransferase involved in cell wall biosynthesis
VSCARTLDSARFDVEVAYVLPQLNALVGELADAGVPAHCLGSGRRLDPSWPWRLRRLLHHGRYDVLHTHMPLPAVAARLVRGRRGPKLVNTDHAIWDQLRRPTYVANLATFSLNDHVFAVSQAVADSMDLRWAPRLRELPPIEVLLHGIELGSSPVPDADARVTARQLLDLPMDALVLGTVGNLTPVKQQSTLLRVLRDLQPAHPGLRLVIVGEGPLRHALTLEARSLGVEDQVVFTGGRDDVARLLPAFDVFVLSSEFEGLSIALVEGLAVGLPSVVTAVGGLPEVIADGVEGLLVPPRSPRAFVQALDRLLSDGELRRRMSVAALERSKSFDIRRAVRRLEEVYEATENFPRAAVCTPARDRAASSPAIDLRASR